MLTKGNVAVAYLTSIALPLPGFASSLDGGSVPVGADRLYYLGWIMSFCTSFVTYIVICKVWPTPNQKIIGDLSLGWEEWAKDGLQSIQASNTTPEPSIAQVKVEDGKHRKGLA